MSPHELLMGMEWAARQFYSLSSIVERMARSRTGLWWNVGRNVGYHLALRNFGEVGFNPEIQTHTPRAVNFELESKATPRADSKPSMMLQ